MTRKKPVTAGELIAKLNAEPGYAARRVLDEQERLRREAEYRCAEAPLIEELRAVGCEVQSAWDLVNTPIACPEAVPILLAHVRRSYPSPVREGIARALAVPETKSLGWTALTRLYVEEADERVKDGLAVAIGAAADDEVIADVVTLARDRRNGPSRLLLLKALQRSKNPRVRAALIDLGSDPDLSEEIRIIVRRLERSDKAGHHGHPRKSRQDPDPE